MEKHTTVSGIDQRCARSFGELLGVIPNVSAANGRQVVPADWVRDVDEQEERRIIISGYECLVAPEQRPATGRSRKRSQ